MIWCSSWTLLKGGDGGGVRLCMYILYATLA